MNKYVILSVLMCIVLASNSSGVVSQSKLHNKPNIIKKECEFKVNIPKPPRDLLQNIHKLEHNIQEAETLHTEIICLQQVEKDTIQEGIKKKSWIKRLITKIK